VALAKAGGSKVKTMSRLTVLAIGMVVAALTAIAALAGSTTPAHSAPVVPEGFTHSQLASGLVDPTDMEFSPDGRLFVTEDMGRVLIVNPNNGTLTTFLDISAIVDARLSRGLHAITFDPAFATNHYVYLHFTRKATGTTASHERVERWTASTTSNTTVAGSEKLIFRIGSKSADQYMGGALDFGPDGKLYVAVGDHDTPANAQKLTNLFGKLVRIGADGTIPTDNPFYTQTTGRNRAIWALGLRNPFKFAIQPGTGTIHINDVQDGGPEEIDRGVKGANYGWPLYQGMENDPKYTDPIFTYQHNGDLATTGCAITGGTFYNPPTVDFPARYVGDYFFADYCNGWIRVRDSGGTVSGFATGLGDKGVVDLEVSKSGELYYLKRSTTGMVSKIGFG
jgi:glucose/arabinose dehydrogenase